MILSLFCAVALLAQNTKAQTWTNVGNQPPGTSITKTASFALYMQTSSDGDPCFSFIDDDLAPNTTGDFAVHLRKFNGTQWVDLGASSPAIPANDFFPLAFEGNTVYMAYSEPAHLANPQKLTVRKYNNGAWETVGNAAFSAAGANSTAMAIDNNKIYVAYADASVLDKVTVKMFDKSNIAAGWQTVGTAGFSTGATFPLTGSGISLVIDSNIPYVCYTDMGLNNGQGALAIKKFNGTGWENVGTNNASNNHLSMSASIHFDASHTPYIAYMDVDDNKGYVRKLNGSNAWVNVGQAPAAEMLANIGLVVLGDIPFVAFGKSDNNNITQVAVRRFNAATDSWVNVGTEMATSSNIEIANLAMATSHNKLYFVYHNVQGHVFARSFDASSILPITLQSFTAAKEKNSSLLKWATGHEENNHHFEVQHSVDGVNFKTIATVASKGNTPTGHQYGFTHALPVKGINYYRLKQVDKNGSFSLSNMVNVVFDQTAIAINIFPNPVKDILHLQHSIPDVKEVILKDVTGRTIKQIRTNALSVDIPVHDLPQGTYLICLLGSNGTETKLFVK